MLSFSKVRYDWDAFVVKKAWFCVNIKGARISNEVLLSLKMAPPNLYLPHREKNNTREERLVIIMAVLADGEIEGRKQFQKQQDKLGSLCLFLLVVNYTYGPVDVPICEGDELSLT